MKQVTSLEKSELAALFHMYKSRREVDTGRSGTLAGLDYPQQRLIET